MLKAGGRDIAHRHAIAFSGGVERQPVTETPNARVQLWRMEAGVVVDLPACSIQVLSGALTTDRETYDAGARQDLHSPVLVKANVATSVLVTTWL